MSSTVIMWGAPQLAQLLLLQLWGAYCKNGPTRSSGSRGGTDGAPDVPHLAGGRWGAYGAARPGGERKYANPQTPDPLYLVKCHNLSPFSLRNRCGSPPIWGIAGIVLSSR